MHSDIGIQLEYTNNRKMKLKKKKKGKEIHFPLSFAPGKRPTSLLFIYLFIL